MLPPSATKTMNLAGGGVDFLRTIYRNIRVCPQTVLLEFLNRRRPQNRQTQAFLYLGVGSRTESLLHQLPNTGCDAAKTTEGSTGLTRG